MRYISIKKSSGLDGTIHALQGSKNSSLALLAASCLSNGKVTLTNVPSISDVDVFVDILKSFGVVICRENDNIMIDASNVVCADIPPEKSKKVRPAYYFIGSILAKTKKITLGYPGGDMIGDRPIDQHIKGLEQLGAVFKFDKDSYTVTCDKLIGKDIYFDLNSVGATINLMLAAVLAKGTTTLNNASLDPEVIDTAIFLNKMGAKISGAGTNIIRIEGVDSIDGCLHQVMPDRLIAGFYFIAAGITGGRVKILDPIQEHLMPLIYKLQEAGMEFEIKEDSITAYSNGYIRPIRITAKKYPTFETDYQQPASVLLLKADGASIVKDEIYPARNNHCTQLRKMGADIRWDNGCAYINGGKRLTGTLVHADDIRSGASLILAGMMAEGTTYINGIEHIERGFENIIKDLRYLGADISVKEMENEHLKKLDYSFANMI